MSRSKWSSLPSGTKTVAMCSIPVLPDVQQLDSEPLARQTLEGQRDIGKALELDAQARIVEAGSLLRISGGVGRAPYRFHLALQRAGVASTVTLRNDSRTSELAAATCTAAFPRNLR